MKPSVIIALLVTCLLGSFTSTAQYKYEREFRLKQDLIPDVARDFIDAIGITAKIKWYKEVGLSSTSYEAKFKYANKSFSIEFDSLGMLQDVEYIIKKKELNPAVYVPRETALDALYHKWKIQKIQLQYIGPKKDILTAIIQGKMSPLIQTSYEIVVKGKAQGVVQLYEISFTKEGVIKEVSQIIQNKADHLEY